MSPHTWMRNIRINLHTIYFLFQSKGCSLQVGQSLSQYYPRTEMSPIVSKESAPGLILATGTIGSTLKGHTSLYVSVDAGIVWYQVSFGFYVFICLAVCSYNVHTSIQVEVGNTFAHLHSLDVDLQVGFARPTLRKATWNLV